MPIRNINDATLTVSSSAVTLADGSPTWLTVKASGAQRAIIIVQTDSVYWSEDGDDATNADSILYAGDFLQYLEADAGEILEKLSFLRVTNDANLKIKYYGGEF